jgi:tetratricopeptide (TPR) repeat protein
MRKFFCLAMLACSTAAFAQVGIVTPDVSQQASVGQTIGVTDIEIKYHRPGVNGRKVWGDLVPFGEVWRAGANDNTTIRFSTPVTIEGQKLDAGTYGLHMIPTPTTWTVIFNKETRAWGSFAYDQAQDALRVTVTPQALADSQERLSYSFDDPQPGSVVAAMRWEKLRVPFRIDVDVNKTVAEDLRHQFTGRARFNPDAWNAAANWALRSNADLDEALGWADQSIKMQRGFRNLRTKAAILEKKGDAKGAADLRAEAMTIATDADLNTYAAQLIAQKKTDEALDVMRKNVAAHPQSAAAFANLGAAYAAKGDKKAATESYAKALTLTADPAVQKRIRDEMAKP